MIKKTILCVLAVGNVSCSTATTPLKFKQLSQQELQELGTKVWFNEGSLRVENLTWWGDAEPFPSLGIGHFVWHPDPTTTSVTQTFPALISFLQQKKVTIPPWLSAALTTGCPWKTRDAFYKDSNSMRMQELHTLLENTVNLQAEFIIKRFEQELPTLIRHLTKKNKTNIQQKIYDLAQTARGQFALVDYVNFKGTGTNQEEQYNGQGWGLLQVLTTMKPYVLPQDAVASFVTSAQQQLTVRVKNKPSEERYLPGWHARIERYKS